jgi:hypothetical protein
MPRRTLLALVAFLAFVSLSLPDGLLGVSWPSLLGFAVTSHWPLIVTTVLTSGHAWRWSYVIAGSAQGLRAAATRCGDPSCGS